MSHHADRWSRVQAMFDSALTRAPEERRAFVEGEAGEDLDLARDVLSLLAAHEEVGGFLEEPVASLPADLLGQPPTHWRDGGMAGHYRVLQQIGRGGMGVVYLAEDTRLKRRVALKVLDSRHVADPRRRERLRKEAQAAARLKHPNIATVYALEEVDGHLCIASEYVAGRTLREIIDARVPDGHEVVRIAAEIAAALDAAHREHVVHRDLKPDNVMVDDQGTVRLLDFGIALTVDADAAEGARLTDPGVLVGTPGYMAPEQIEGRPVDVRTDQFLFGIVVFELATGVHPFGAATRAATDVRILTAEPARISGHGLLVDLDRVLRTCLQKAPERRYPSTARLVEEMVRLRSRVDEPASAVSIGPDVPVPTPGSASPVTWWRVHQLVVSAAISGMLVGAWWLAAWIGPPYRFPLFFGLLVAGVADVTLRMHLLFVERETPAIMPRQLRRSARWLTRLDIAFGAAYGLAALAVSEAHPLAAGFALAAAAILVIAALVIEPATTDEAHGQSVDSRQ